MGSRNRTHFPTLFRTRDFAAAAAAMKSLLLSIALASVAFAVAAAQDAAAVGAADDNEGYYPRYNRYCCYEVKKYLENRISTAENRADGLIRELRNNIKVNLDKLGKMEKKIEEKEGADYERIKAEVRVLTSVVGDLEDALKELRDVDKNHYEHLQKEIR